MFIKLFSKSQFPHKSVDLSFILVIIKDKSTDLCSNYLLQKHFVNTSCEISFCCQLQGTEVFEELSALELATEIYKADIKERARTMWHRETSIGGACRGSVCVQSDRISNPTLEVTQGQISSQSHSDATRFWTHLYGS